MQNLMLLFVSAVGLSEKVFCLGYTARVGVGGNIIYTVGVFFREQSNKSFSEELQQLFLDFISMWLVYPKVMRPMCLFCFILCVYIYLKWHRHSDGRLHRGVFIRKAQ